MEQIVEISAESFEREVKGADKPSIVEFWIRSCSNCQKFKPIYEQLPQIFGDKVKFLKNLPRKELIGILRRSTLFCLPSVIEGFGLTTIEAAACGIPYVISNIETNIEVTDGGKGGLLFKKENVEDLKDKLEKLLTDKDLYQRKQHQCWQLAKKYSWQKIAKETEGVYRKIR